MPMARVWSLSAQQLDVEERVRTISLGITALGVVVIFLYLLRSALLPLVVALALKHLLQPVIRWLSERPLICCGKRVLGEPIACTPQPAGPGSTKAKRWWTTFLSYACRLQLPRTTAIIVAVLLAFAVLGILAAIVADSVRMLMDHADVYANRLKQVLSAGLGWIEYFSCGWTPRGCPQWNNATNATNTTSPADEVASELEKLLASVPLSDLVLSVAESLLETVSDLFVVCLFTIYLLLGKPQAAPTKADEHILAYIKGKVALSALIGLTTWLTLLAIGLDLALVFGVLAFWLNFIPNVGAVVAVLMPMPLVVLDPDMPPASMVVAFAVPFAVHNFVGNVIEPLVFGKSLELQPVVILLALMIWWLLWGLTGTVLAVPMTAVLKLHLDAVDHPAAQYLVRLLVGSEESDAQHGEASGGLPPAEDVAPLNGSSHANAMESASRPLVASGPHDAGAAGGDAA